MPCPPATRGVQGPYEARYHLMLTIPLLWVPDGRHRLIARMHDPGTLARAVLRTQDGRRGVLEEVREDPVDLEGPPAVRVVCEDLEGPLSLRVNLEFPEELTPLPEVRVFA